MRFVINYSLFLIFLAIVLIPTFLHADWPPGGLVVCGEFYDQETPMIVSDGAGGAIIAWNDGRNDIDSPIYAQRVDGSGNPYWTGGGLQISPDGTCYLLDMVSDGQTAQS